MESLHHAVGVLEARVDTLTSKVESLANQVKKAVEHISVLEEVVVELQAKQAAARPIRGFSAKDQDVHQ